MGSATVGYASTERRCLGDVVGEPCYHVGGPQRQAAAAVEVSAARPTGGDYRTRSGVSVSGMECQPVEGLPA